MKDIIVMKEELYNKITKITGTEYKENGVLDFYGLSQIIEDLVEMYNHKEEELEDFIRDREENYKLIDFDPYSEYGVSESDFH